jgi:predicted nucleic acid-binding protein
MSQIVVDTDVASYVFNWHSSSARYLRVLRGSELMLSFMSVSELRAGALLAR